LAERPETRATLRKAGVVPHRTRVAGHERIGGDQQQTLRFRLRKQQAVKRIRLPKDSAKPSKKAA
jgi:hypothetical protein